MSLHNNQAFRYVRSRMDNIIHFSYLNKKHFAGYYGQNCKFDIYWIWKYIDGRHNLFLYFRTPLYQFEALRLWTT